MTSLEKFTDTAYVLLRIMAGAMFACHGLQHLLGWPAGHAAPVASQVWVGGLIELAGGAAVLLGAVTRFAAFLCSGTMAVAYLQFHWKFHMGSGFWPGFRIVTT